MQGDGGDHSQVFERAWVSPLIPDCLREGLADVAGEVLRLPHDCPLEAPQAGDLVVLMADEPGAFVFSLRLKEPGGKRVHVAMVTGGGDAERAAAIARFCMADAVVDASEAEEDMSSALGEIRRIGQRRGPVDSIDVLLARLEERMEGGARELAERVARGLSDERERSFVESVTDADTGLFAGPFMAYKLEEEFKRSWRFRTQLAVVLFDLPATSTLEGSERARVFGEVAGVFLNESRDIDVLGRYDDTSFLMLLPHTGPSGAKVLASRILASLARIEASTPLETAVAIVAVPSVGVERKDELLDLARMTLVEAWASSGDERIRVAT
ncbi:MAG: diguanylate cyclase [Planctomycetes bacterium]|nr:diguanylate cyclase [Planctomycetota bacterium]